MVIPLFFDSIKKSLFHGKLSTSQEDGMIADFSKWAFGGYTDLRWLAYIFATEFHETAGTMQPIEEYGKGRGKRYGTKTKRSGVHYNIPDKLYYGRGKVQLTWFENYEMIGRLLKIDLLYRPEMALEMTTSIDIMFEGMMKGSSSFGDFTGKCLEMYFNDKVNDPYNARRIINGLDKANLIKGYYERFLEALMIY